MDISNDSGFGFRKTMGNGKQIKFSSLVGDIQKGDFALAGTLSKQPRTIEVDGLGGFAFGSTAQTQSALPSHAQDSEWVLSDQYLAGVLLGISSCMAASTHNVAVRLTTGLPYKDFSRYSQALKDRLLGSYRVRRNGQDSQLISIEKVLRIPQGFGPIFYHLLDEKGLVRKVAPIDNIRIGCCNIGSNTVEIATIDVDLSDPNCPGLDMVKIGTDSRAIGTFTMLPLLRDLLAEQYPGQHFDDFELLEILETGLAWRYGNIQEIDLGPIKAKFQEMIIDTLSNVYKDTEKGRLFSIVATGGGAHLVDLSSWHQNIWLSNDPQWDTAAGYAKARKLQDRLTGGKYA